MVFQVFLISDLYLSKVNAKYCCLAAHMLVLNMLLYVLRLIINVSYSLEAGLLNLIFLIILNRIERSNPLVIHFDFYVYICCISQVYLSCECFCFFNDIMYYIIANIRVCCQTFIYFVVQFGRVYISIYIVYDIFKLYVFSCTFWIVTTKNCYV